MAKKQSKQQVNWRLSETAREIVTQIQQQLGVSSQGNALEIILREEATRRGIVVKSK